MSLNSNLVISRRNAFACCAAEASKNAIAAKIVGDEDCYKNYMRIAVWYRWGADVMARTPADGDDTCCSGNQCVTDEFALATINKLDALDGCVKCGCGSPADRPLTCDITPDLTVYQALDADQQLVGPNVAGRTTLITTNINGVSNGWSANLGKIATDDGTGVFTYTIPAFASVIYAATQNSYFVTYAGGAGPLYPEIDGNLVFFDLTLMSRWPGVTLQYSRDVLVETSPDGTTWAPVYFGTETALAYGLLLTPVTNSPTLTRSTYYYNEYNTCSAGPVAGSIPPFIAPPCGIIAYTITPDSTCATENWTIDINFTQIDGWSIGTATPVVNGVPGTGQAITLGTLTFGPFIMGDLVTFTIVNNLDAGCDITTGIYFDPRVVEQDFNVLRAVDANEYAALNADGNDYYIVSNVDSLVAEWGLNVGSIWLGASSTYQAVANLETVYATNPGGALGFWQDDAGVPKQYLPQPTYTYNTVTLITAVTLPPVAPFTQAWSTLFMQAFWTPVAGSPVTIYNGAPGAFTPSAFTIPVTTTWAAVTGIAVYTDGCAVPVPALLDTFTPVGPDPDFSEIGVNAGVNSSAQGPGGSFYIGGFFTEYDETGAGIPANRFTRLLDDGTLDTAFNSVVTDTSFMLVSLAGTAAVNGVYTQGANINGRPSWVFTAAGVTHTINWTGTAWRLFNNTTATLMYHSNDDEPFPSSATPWVVDTGALPVPTVTTGGFNADLRSIAVDSQGRIVCAGSFILLNNVTANRIVRLMPDGTRDATFVTVTGFNQVVNRVRIQSDDKVVCSGAFNMYNGAFVGRIVRLNVNGSIDTTFNYNVAIAAPYAGFNAPAYRNEIDADGTILVNSGQSSFDAYTDSSGTVVVMPNWSTFKKAVVRLNANGTLNSTVTQGSGVSGMLLGTIAPTNNSFAIQPDGKIICVGSFATYDGATVNAIVRMDRFGVLDAAFLANTGTGFDSVNAQTTSVLILPNGQILVGCQSGVDYQGTPVFGLIRLNADGTLDGAFNIGTGFNNSVIDITITTLGSIIVGGNFTDLDGTPRWFVAKF